MGHAQRAEARCLGLGWIYDGLARVSRPRTALVIGSWRGFVPLVLSRALKDNGDGGEVTFVDPSLVDDFWRDSSSVADWFARFGAGNIRHFPSTSQEFASGAGYAALESLDLAFIDGYHALEQVRFDFEICMRKLAPGGWILLHDSLRVRDSGIYGHGRSYRQEVRLFVDELRGDGTLELLDLPYGDGVTLLRKRGA